MNGWNAIWLGILQGLTEFLPISSSAHLILARFWFNWDLPTGHEELLFDLALHVGTCAALILYFWRDLGRFLRAIVSGDPAERVNKRLAWGIVLGCLPAALVGALFEEPIEAIFRERVALICAFLIGVGVLMGLADWIGAKHRAMEGLSLLDAFLIGCAQALALLPGFSRSGITITAGLLLGFQREAAARFSFLLSVPITLGAALWSFRKVFQTGIPTELVMPMAMGTGASTLVGLLSIAFLLNYLRTRTLLPFVIYRLLLGSITLWHLK